MQPEEWLTAVLSRVVANLPPRFAGLGLVLYVPPLRLPVTPLVPPGQVPSLPQGDLSLGADLLRRLSDSASALHDGFHLVDAQSLEITHVCHFFAPPIPADLSKMLPDRPVGARFMAALLGSLLPSVVMTAVLSDSEGAMTIERGAVRRLPIARDST